MSTVKSVAALLYFPVCLVIIFMQFIQMGTAIVDHDYSQASFRATTIFFICWAIDNVSRRKHAPKTHRRERVRGNAAGQPMSTDEHTHNVEWLEISTGFYAWICIKCGQIVEEADR